jgi:hypothetical protein
MRPSYTGSDGADRGLQRACCEGDHGVEPEVEVMGTFPWIKSRGAPLRGVLVWSGVLALLTACAVSPPPDGQTVMSPSQVSRAMPSPTPPARVITRYNEFFDATSVEYRAATSAQLTFLAYYTYHGRTPSSPAATLNLGCVIHPVDGHSGQGEGARLIFWVAGQGVDFGELRFTPDPLGDSYWRDGVPRQEVVPLLQGHPPEGSCGGMRFQLSSEQWETFQAFVGSAAAEQGR